MAAYSAEWVGANLEAVMADRGLDAEDLASALGTSPSTVHRWLRSEVLPRLPGLADLCEVLDCTPDELMGCPL